MEGTQQVSMPDKHKATGQMADKSVEPLILGWEEGLMEHIVFPRCGKCQSGELVPLSDFGPLGAEVLYKAWVCTNPGCGFNLKIRNGDVYLNEPILSSTFHRTGMVRREASKSTKN